MDNNKRIRRKVRNAYIISTVSVALVLFLLGSVGYLILGALGTTQRLKESMTVYVMLSDTVSAQTTTAIGEKLKANRSVREMKFIGKDQAAQEFQEYLGDDFIEFLDQNPLPDAYELKMTAAASDKASLEALEKEVSTWEGVNEVVYQRGVLEQIGQNINKFNLILLLFGGYPVDYCSDLAEQCDSGDNLCQTLHHRYDETGRGHTLVYHAAFPRTQYPTGNICRFDLLGDAGRYDDGSA